MRIVHVFKDFYPPLAAGITCYIADVSDAMARRGHEVEVHVAGVHLSRRERLDSGVIVHRHREIRRVLSMPLALGLIREVKTLEADIVHVHLPNPIGELGVLLNRRVPVVCSFHAQLGRQRALEPLYAPLREKLFDHASSVLVSGEKLAVAHELRRHRDKVHILPYGVSPRLKTTASRMVESAPGALQLIFVGRLVYYKGVDVLLRAIALVPDSALLIIGDGIERHRLEALANDLGVSERVRFVGLISDDELARAYADADVFVLPSVSRAEAFGLAMVEAMANGVPAVSTGLGTGTDWVNVDGVSGLVVAPSDPHELADAIQRLRDPVLRKTLGDGAAQRAVSLFGFDTHVNELESIYRQARA